MKQTNILIGEQLLKFLSKKLVAEIKKSNFSIIDELGHELLSNFKLIDSLREYIDQEDLNILEKGIESNYVQTRGLFITLLKDYINVEKVSNFLKHIWNKTNDFSEKNKIMFRLLEIDNLDTELLYSFYEFINTNWEKFLSSVVYRTGGKDKVMDYVIRRINDCNFPEKKNWVYLCCSLASNDEVAVLNLLNSHKDADYPFDNDFINVLKNKIKILNNKKEI